MRNRSNSMKYNHYNGIPYYEEKIDSHALCTQNEEKKRSDDDRQFAQDYIPSIIGSDDEDDDKDSSFPEGFFPFEEDSSASRVYIGDEYAPEVVNVDRDELIKDDISSNENFKKLVEKGISSESLMALPLEKLRFIIRGQRHIDITTLLEGKRFVYCEFKGIAPSELIEIINNLEVEKLDLFLDFTFNVLSFIHYNNTIKIVELFRFERGFIKLLLNNSFPISKLIEANPEITLKDIVTSGYETVKAAITYFSHLKRNSNISFNNFATLYRLYGKEINYIFEAAKIYPNDNNVENPSSRLKIIALKDIQSANKKGGIQDIMRRSHIRDSHNLVLCDILFSSIEHLIDAIDKYPSAKYQERKIDYIIKLYEESKDPKVNKTRLERNFSGFILFYSYEISLILREGCFSLDDLQSVSERYPNYLEYILMRSDVRREWVNKKTMFYEAIGLTNGDEFFMSLRKESPDLLIFYMKFAKAIEELIVNNAITISDIKDMYDVSINSLDKFFEDKDAILRWNESKEDFYKAVDLKNGDDFFRDPRRKRMDLFMLVVKFKDEILYMHTDSIMRYEEMIDIYNKDPIVLQSILSNVYKFERLIFNEDYRDVDKILQVFAERGINCLKDVDIINGGFSNPVMGYSKEELANQWYERYRNNCNNCDLYYMQGPAILKDPGILKGPGILKDPAISKGPVTFNETARIVIFSIQGTPSDLMRTAIDNTDKSITSLPSLRGYNNTTIVNKSDNFDASMKSAVSSVFPSIKHPEDSNKKELCR